MEHEAHKHLMTTPTQQFHEAFSATALDAKNNGQLITYVQMLQYTHRLLGTRMSDVKPSMSHWQNKFSSKSFFKKFSLDGIFKLSQDSAGIN